MIIASFAAFHLTSAVSVPHCGRGEPCWPTRAEIAHFNKTLGSGNFSRVLYWKGKLSPRPCAVPLDSPDQQPLYGFGKNGLNAVYSGDGSATKFPCFTEENETRPICFTAMRNNPMENWNPAFVVWAVSTEQVRTAVQFARRHNLCIMAAGEGHEFLNRHSCDQGLMIRTTLLKSFEWDPNDKKEFGSEGGSVRVGAGVTFSELEYSASQHDRFVSSGWAVTVGIVGWSIGGGHGPFAPSAGLGVDNILEAEIVLENGTAVTVNSSINTDLFWAIRGGGGSTWGIITSLTIRAHKNPESGFTLARARWNGSMCSADKHTLHNLIDKYLDWALNLDKKWSGLAFIAPQTSSSSQCGGNWTFTMQYVFLGSNNEANDTWKNITSSVPGVGGFMLECEKWWDEVKNYELEPIHPTPWLAPTNNNPGGLPSVFVDKDVVTSGRLSSLLKSRLNDCPNEGICQIQQLYTDITGHKGSPQEPNVSISSGFRTSLFHIIFGYWNDTITQEYYSLGSNSYFSESAYNMRNWKERYWGNNYQKLKNIKTQWDPLNVFWCRHCVGDEM